MLIGAVNAYTQETNSVKNQLTGEYDTVPSVQRYYKAHGIGSVVIAYDNYGEGSSREHAAMEPRYLGVKAIVTKSFARIHETNLKKQGMLAITFANESDYELIREDDTIDIIDLKEFAPDRQLTLVLRHNDGTNDTIKVNHTYNAGQILWFKAGSALNLMAKEIAAKEGFKQPVKNKGAAENAAKTAGKRITIKPAAKSKPSAKTLKPASKKAIAEAPAKKVAKKTANKVAKKAKPAKKGLLKKAVSKVVKLVKKVTAKKKGAAAPKKSTVVKKGVAKKKKK